MKTPTPEQVDTAIARLGKPGANAYFFDNLKNPLWIAPLAKKGFFQRPPEPQRQENEGTISFPDWPELRFLLRMAPSAPDTVGEVVTSIPDTENVRVRQMLIEIGAHLNLKFSRKLGIRALDWVDDYFLRSHFGEPVPKLITRLAEQGEVKVALELARRMFRVDEDDTGRSRSGLDAWYLERYLASCLPTLRACAGLGALELLRDLLLVAAKPSSEDAAEDYSYIWRTSILKPNFADKQGRDVLIDVLRDSALEFARDPKIGAEHVIRLLLAPDRPLLKRIGLYVASQAARADDPVVMELLSNLSLVDRPTCHEEYALLLQATFPHLPQLARERLEQLIVTDPLQSIPEETRQQMDAGKLGRIAKQVLRDRLIAFGQSLPDSLSTTLAGLVQEVGDPPERHSVVTAFAPGSPISSEELQALPVEQIADYARKWVSSNDFSAPKPEGLARAIAEAIKGRLKEFADHADTWIGHDPTYVRWIITAFGDALRSKAVIENWAPLLRVVRWAVTQEDAEPLSADDPWAERDTTWRWTRQSATRLIETALQHKESRPPFQYRTEVWGILHCLLTDPDPAVGDEASSDQDHLSVSINSTRGLATHALIRYLWWVHENTERTQPFTFDAMPEARDALEGALTDAHPAILSTFGEWFRQLYFLDAAWTRARIEVIFPAAEDRREFWRASWHTFMDYSPPYDPAFDILRAKYDLGIERLQPEPHEGRKRSGERGLGEHLGSYFWRGVGGEFTRELVLRYFNRCSPAAAGHTVFFFGRGLATEREIPTNTVGALMQLWDEMKGRGGGWSEQKRREVARQFGQWFVSKHLPAEWRLHALEDILSTGAGIVDPEALFVELTALVGAHPRPVARCLRLLLLDQQQSWYPLLRERESTTALEALLTSNDETARKDGLDLINALVERGDLAARDIAQRANPQKPAQS